MSGRVSGIKNNAKSIYYDECVKQFCIHKQSKSIFPTLFLYMESVEELKSFGYSLKNDAMTATKTPEA